MSRRPREDTDLKTALAQQVLVFYGQPSSLHQRQPQLVRRLILVCRLQFTVGIGVEVELRVVAPPVKKSKFHGAVVLHRRVDLHAIFMIPARCCGGASASDALVDFHTDHHRTKTSRSPEIFDDALSSDRACRGSHFFKRL